MAKGSCHACAAGRRALARTHDKACAARALVEAALATADLFTRPALAQALAHLRQVEIDTAVVNPPHTERRAESRQKPAEPAAEAPGEAIPEPQAAKAA
jgi:hypothetical protein